MAGIRNLPVRSQPRRPARSRRNYREPDSDTDFGLDPDVPSSRPARSGRQRRSYRESSTSDGSELDQPLLPDDPTPELSTQPSDIKTIRRTAPRRSRRKRGREPVARAFKDFKRRKVNTVDAGLTEKPLSSILPLPRSGRAPPWQTLEYQILVKIMTYVARSLQSSTVRSGASTEWLVGMSRLCKGFYEPAMAALLSSPPLLPAHYAHGLLSCLARDQDTLRINHRTKIRALEIEVKQLLLAKSGISLENLLSYTPLLKHLRIYHYYDDWVARAPWATPVFGKIYWAYSDLCSLLDQNAIRLQSFEWSGRFRDTMEALATSHESVCMQGLKTVTFTGFVFSEKRQAERDKARDIVATALSHLHELTSLCFQNCTIIDTQLLSRVPTQLQTLSVTNCFGLTSEVVEEFLKTSGSFLTDLILAGNQVMSLGFIPRLKEFCPHLRNLQIDLSYQDSSSWRDNEPLYDDLLPQGPPTWPSPLETLVVGPLRTLTLTNAEEFYTSLVMAADELPYLRVLSLKTILKDASWRDRAQLRQKWSSIFPKVFLKKKAYASKTAESLPWKQADSRPSQGAIVVDISSKRRKSVRIQELEDISQSENTQEHDSADDAPLDLDGILLPAHNRCNVVEFDLSDQRPAQEQYREEDFLDAELSGDEDWNGRDAVES